MVRLKYTQKQADELDKSIGAIPIGIYIAYRTKREYKCTNCNNTYMATSHNVKRKKQIYCPQCRKIQQYNQKRHSIEYVKQVCIQHNLIPLFNEYLTEKTLIKLQCMCGSVFKTTLGSIKYNNIVSCGHCNDPKINTKYNQLTPIIIFPDKRGGCSVVCECDCGKDTKIIHGTALTNDNNRQKGCGHCNDPNIGDNFNSLTIIDIKTNTNGGGGCKIKCRCNCGNETKWYNSYKIISGDIKSCGNCMLSRNGRATSHTALQLHNLIEQILGQKCEHNFHIKGLGCVDICQPELKIAIEYDSYYNHKIRNGDRSQYDKAKYKKLVTNDWKLLNIKSDGTDLPTEKQLRKVLLNDFQHGSKKRTITMNSWKQQESKNAC